MAVATVLLSPASTTFAQAAGPCPIGGHALAPADVVKIKVHLASQLKSVVAWFAKGARADGGARMTFPTWLDKTQRADVHAACEKAGLVSMSTGVGVNRRVAVTTPEAAKRQSEGAQTTALTEKEELKARWLLAWAREEGLGRQYSRDEVREMVREDVLPAPLAALWKRRTAEQKGIKALCAAAAQGDVRAAKAALQNHPEVPRMALGGRCDQIVDCLTGVAPMHVAAGQGHEAMLTFLLDVLKLPVDTPDGQGLTAAEVAHQCNQGAAAAMLHARGAREPRSPPPAPEVAVHDRRRAAAPAKKGPRWWKASSGSGGRAKRRAKSTPSKPPPKPLCSCLDYTLAATAVASAAALSIAVALLGGASRR